MTSLLLELQRHDEASPIICRGLLLRIFRILSTQYEFSLSKKLRQKMNWILYEEISDYMKQLREAVNQVSREKIKREGRL